MIGMIIGLFGIPMPKFFTAVVDSASACMSPVAMILTGVTVLGMRILGLWGSKTSRYKRRNTPPLLPTFLKHTYKFFGPKRVVTIEIEDITVQVKEWAKLGEKMAFNAKLEEFYNQPWAETGHESGV